MRGDRCSELRHAPGGSDPPNGRSAARKTAAFRQTVKKCSGENESDSSLCSASPNLLPIRIPW